MHAKTPMGLEPFEVRFFFGEIFSKFDLALKLVIKNRSKVILGVSAVFITIKTNYFFCVKSPMGTRLDSIFFYTDFFFQLGSRGQGGIKMKICFGTIKDLPI